MQALRKLKIIGNGREKVVTLREEAQQLDLEKSYCFLLLAQKYV
jgi:hypothetical protein